MQSSEVLVRHLSGSHDKPGMYLEPGQIVTMPLRDLAPSFVTKCRERFHARGPQRGNVGGEHGGHTEHDE